MLAFVQASSALAQTKLLTQIGEIAPYFRSCWRSPEKPANLAIAMTVGFALRVDGSLIGEAHITHITAGLPEPLRDRYKAAALRMFAMCGPAPVTAGLGRAIAGRQFRMQFIDPGTTKEDPEPWRKTPKTPSSWRRLKDA